MFSRLSRFALLCVLCVWAVNSVAAAQPDDRRNAATWYAQAHEALMRLPAEDRMLIWNYDWAQPPTPEERAALGRAGPALGHIQRGAVQEHSAVPFDRSGGVAATIPHLADLRRVARLLHTDAMVRLHDGDAPSAAQRMGWLYRASLHPGHDNTIVGALVGTALFGLAEMGVEHALDHAALGPGEAALILREVERIADRDDPFNYLGAVAGDHNMLVEWVGGSIGEPDAQERLNALLGDNIHNADEDRSDLIRQISAMDSDAFGLAVQQLDHMTDRVIEVMSMNDPDEARAAMARLTEEVNEGEFGPLAMLSSPWDRVLRSKLYAKDRLALRIESLRDLVEGSAQPHEVANAAVWYRRAIDLIEKFNHDDLALIRAFAAQAEIEPEEGEHTVGRMLEPMLLFSRPIVDVLRDGSSMRRCSFEAIERDTFGPAPDYAPGMRDALRLLHADALRLLRLGDHVEAADRFAIAYRVIAHLSGDPHPVSSIVAHRAFLEGHAILEIALGIEQFGTAERQMVVAAVEGIDIGDPFGYLASHRRLRERLLGQVRHAERLAERRERNSTGEQSGPGAAATMEAATNAPTSAEVIRGADDGATLYYSALIHYSFRAPETLDEERAAAEQERQRERIAGLHDALNAEELIEAWRDGTRLATQLREGHRAELHTFDVLPLNALADRRHRARADLRATSALLRFLIAH